MKHYITLSDADIVSMDESTGNIVLPLDKLPPRLSSGEQVNISYKEDADGITHNYVIDVVGKDQVTLTWVEKLEQKSDIKEEMLTESPVVRLDDSDMMNPDSISFKDKISKGLEDEAEAARKAAEQAKVSELKTKYAPVFDKLSKLMSGGTSAETILDKLFDDLVPRHGAAETVAGELVRAIMRIIYRDYNDGDKFFDGYGIQTCGSSAEYLFDHGFSSQIQDMLDRAYQLNDDDDAYTDKLYNLSINIIEHLLNNEELFYTPNKEDSRDYSTSYIEDHKLKYEFKVPSTAETELIVSEGLANGYDLVRYVEDALENDSVYTGAEVSVWSNSSASVEVSNLTKDGYEMLERACQDSEEFWEDFVNDYSEELASLSYDDDYDA